MHSILRDFANAIRDRARRRELWEENVAPKEEHKPATVDPTAVVLTRRLLAEADPKQAPECATGLRQR